MCVGDLNVAFLDIDLHNPTAKHIPKQAGVTARERESFRTLLNTGMVVGLYIYTTTDLKYLIKAACVCISLCARIHGRLSTFVSMYVCWLILTHLYTFTFILTHPNDILLMILT